jgi:cytochrome c peroxidase
MRKVLVLALLVALTMVGVAGFLHGAQDDGRRRDRPRRVRAAPVPLPSALPLSAQAPADNPSDPDRIALGRLLFWDPILSGAKDVACATCHHPDFGYAENLDISIGVTGVGLSGNRRFVSPGAIPFVKRNSQTILNTAFNGIDRDGLYNAGKAPMFWDLRVTSLETQALEPLKTFEEMRGNAYPAEAALDVVVARLNAIAEYRTLFAAAFDGGSAVTAPNVGRALAAFERSLVVNRTPFDRYMRGDRTAMTPAQIRGMGRFERIGCTHCHNGPMFSDYKLHVLSVPDNRKLPESDSGTDGTYAFRTATLRNLAFTAPYMHSGVFRTLEDVVRFYDDVADGDSENPHVGPGQLDPLLGQLDDVDDGRRDLIEFLGALGDDAFDKTVPTRVPSGLPPGGNLSMTAGTGR